MKCDYLSLGGVYRPCVKLMLCSGHNLYPRSFTCLVDSGSDSNLFPAQIAELLKIKLTKDKAIIVYGIGKSKVTAYRHNLKIYMGAINFMADIDFAYQQPVPLLGRKGFFDNFKTVTFNEKEKFVELA
jgi:hypothetical protein